MNFAPWYSTDSASGRAWDGELADYRAARKQGIQPASTKKKDIDAAVALSRAADKPFDASTGKFEAS